MKNDPFKTCNGLKPLGRCPPDYAWAFQNGKMCCSCGRMNQRQVMEKNKLFLTTANMTVIHITYVILELFHNIPYFIQ